MTARAVANLSAFANPNIVNPLINRRYCGKISDAVPTGSRVSPAGLKFAWNGNAIRGGKAKNFADPSGNTDAATYGTMAIGDVSGLRGAGTHLDGGTNYLKTAGKLAFAGAFTALIACKINTVKASELMQLSGYYADIYLNASSNVVASDSGTTGWPDSLGKAMVTTTIPGAGVHTLAFTASNAYAAVLMDNVVLESATGGTVSSYNGYLSIGNGANNYFSAIDIYEVLFFARALSLSEIAMWQQDLYAGRSMA